MTDVARWFYAVLAALLRWFGLARPKPAARVELRVPDEFPTVQAAVDAAPARGAVIIIAPGRHACAVLLRRKELALVHGGGPGACTLHCDENTVLVVEGEQAACAARGLRFETAIGGCFAVWARMGARLELDGCEVSSGQSTGVVVETAATLEMRDCAVSDCVGFGVFAKNAGTRARLERCVVRGSRRRGLFARWGATAVARGCAFAANAAEAVAFYDCGSGGEVVGCDLTANARGGVVFGHGAREEDVRCSGNT